MSEIKDFRTPRKSKGFSLNSEVKKMPENKTTERIIKFIGYLGIALGTVGIIILVIRILTKSWARIMWWIF